MGTNRLSHRSRAKPGSPSVSIADAAAAAAPGAACVGCVPASLALCSPARPLARSLSARSLAPRGLGRPRRPAFLSSRPQVGWGGRGREGTPRSPPPPTRPPLSPSLLGPRRRCLRGRRWPRATIGTRTRMAPWAVADPQTKDHLGPAGPWVPVVGTLSLPAPRNNPMWVTTAC